MIHEGSRVRSHDKHREYPSLRRVAKCSDIVGIDTDEGLTFGGQNPSARLITLAPAPRRED